MKEILLTRGMVAIVDDEDFASLSVHRWYWMKVKVGTGYAVRNSKVSDGFSYNKRVRILMHTVVSGAPKHLETDHLNGNGLDNRRCNLRVCSHAENLSNCSKNKLNTSGHRGVYLIKKSGKYLARLRNNGENFFLGHFATYDLAVSVYRDAYFKMFGRECR